MWGEIKGTRFTAFKRLCFCFKGFKGFCCFQGFCCFCFFNLFGVLKDLLFISQCLKGLVFGSLGKETRLSDQSSYLDEPT